MSPNDEFADNKPWNQGNLDLSVPKAKEVLQYEYARSALQIGLKLKAELGGTDVFQGPCNVNNVVVS